jgi:hypothetical protein
MCLARVAEIASSRSPPAFGEGDYYLDEIAAGVKAPGKILWHLICECHFKAR